MADNYRSPTMSMLGLTGGIQRSGQESQKYSGDISEWGSDYQGTLSAGRQIGAVGAPVLYSLLSSNPVTAVPLAIASFLGSLFGGGVAEEIAPPPPEYSNYDIQYGMADLEELEAQKDIIESQSDFSYDAMSAINSALQTYLMSNYFGIGTGADVTTDVATGTGAGLVDPWDLTEMLTGSKANPLSPFRR